MKKTKLNVVEELERIVKLLREDGPEKEKKPLHYLDGQDVMQLLHISPRTLRKLRTSGQLPHCRLSKKKHYYLPDDVDQMIRKNRKG